MIRKAEKRDIPELVKLANLPGVWCDDEEKLREDFRELLASEKDLVAVSEEEGRVIAFANVRIRSEYVSGTTTSPVGYLEGVAVFEEFRKKGIAKTLFDFCLCWVKEKGCTELGSDCLVDNEESIAFHKALGFKEIERTIHYAKEI